MPSRLFWGWFCAAAPQSGEIDFWPTAVVVEFLRDTPLLVQLFFLYYVLPEFGIVLPAFLTGALALGLQYAAYTSEVYRGGMEAVHHGQWKPRLRLI